MQATPMRPCLPSYMLTILTRLALSMHCASAVAGTAARVAAASGAVSVSVSVNMAYIRSVLVMKAFADGAEVSVDAGADLRSQLRDHDDASLAQPRMQHRLHLQHRGRVAFGQQTCVTAATVVDVIWAEVAVVAVAAKRRKWKLGS